MTRIHVDREYSLIGHGTKPGEAPYLTANNYHECHYSGCRYIHSFVLEQGDKKDWFRPFHTFESIN